MLKIRKINCLSPKLISGTLPEIPQNVKRFGSRSGPYYVSATDLLICKYVKTDLWIYMYVC